MRNAAIDPSNSGHTLPVLHAANNGRSGGPATLKRARRGSAEDANAPNGGVFEGDEDAAVAEFRLRLQTHSPDAYTRRGTLRRLVRRVNGAM